MKLKAVKWNWKTQVALEGYPGYILMMDGTIICSLNQKTEIKKPHTTKSGYKRVSMLNKSGKWCIENVHDLVIKYFTDEQKPENAHIINIDGNKSRSIIDNLAFGTRSELYRYYKEIGVHKQGLPHTGLPISVRCVETGTHYTSLSQAALDLGLSRPEIGKHIHGHIKHVKGYHFERV